MKTIGLIGGLSWESSALYYKILNETVREELGQFRSCQSIMYSFDFEPMAQLQHDGKAEEMASELAKIAVKLENAGADFIVMCSNTIHKYYDFIQSQINVPLIHIVDATAATIAKTPARKLGFLGTKYSMTGDFVRGRYRDKYGYETIIPDGQAIEDIQNIIFNELVAGQFKPQSKARFIEIIDDLIAQGAEGIIAGCTEIELLIRPEDIKVPLFETTRLHAEYAARLAIKA